MTDKNKWTKEQRQERYRLLLISSAVMILGDSIDADELNKLTLRELKKIITNVDILSCAKYKLALEIKRSTFKKYSDVNIISHKCTKNQCSDMLSTLGGEIEDNIERIYRYFNEIDTPTTKLLSHLEASLRILKGRKNGGNS